MNKSLSDTANKRFSLFETLKGQIIVSCQARKGQPLDRPEVIALLAQAAEEGGAAALRINGVNTIKIVKKCVSIPILGILKRKIHGKKIFITPEVEDAQSLIEAGASIVALECTFQDDRREKLPELVSKIKRDNPGILLMADVSTLEEALFAEETGFDFIAPTLRGYTPYTNGQMFFDDEIYYEFSRKLTTPVIAEGHIKQPFHAKAALNAGAYAVVVGKAITMPSEITRWFVEAIRQYS